MRSCPLFFIILHMNKVKCHPFLAIFLTNMRIIYNKIIPFGRYTAINLFGVVFARKGRTINKVVINHEYIHTLQQRELLWIPFFILYVGEWLLLLIRYRSVFKAYRNISFEREAYDHEHDMNYPRKRRFLAQYRR